MMGMQMQTRRGLQLVDLGLAKELGSLLQCMVTWCLSPAYWCSIWHHIHTTTMADAVAATTHHVAPILCGCPSSRTEQLLSWTLRDGVWLCGLGMMLLLCLSTRRGLVV